MTIQFTLTEKEFKKAESLFEALEVKADPAVGMNYQELTVRKRCHSLLLTYHPDKNNRPNSEKFQRIHKAYPILRKYIKSLKCGKSDITVDTFNIDVNGDKCVIAREFHYGRKWFEGSGMYEEDVVGKSYEELLLKLKPFLTRDRLEKDKEFYKSEFCKKNGHTLNYPVDSSHRKLYKYLFPNDILFALEKSTDIIREDKVELVSKIIEVRDF